MTEFELALDFLQAYVQAAVAAAEKGEAIDDAREFRRYCHGLGVEITPERVDLTRDLAGVIKECLARDTHEESEGSDEDTHLIAASCLLEGLETYGWRLSYLQKDVAD
jgi:hypothetical protein